MFIAWYLWYFGWWWLMIIVMMLLVHLSDYPCNNFFLKTPTSMELRFIFKYKFHSLLQRNTDFSLDNFVSSLITALWIGKCTHYSLNTLTSEHKTRWTSTLFAEVEHSSNGHHARPHNNGEGGKTHGGGILEGCTLKQKSEPFVNCKGNWLNCYT